MGIVAIGQGQHVPLMCAEIKTVFEAVFLGGLLLKCEGMVRRQNHVQRLSLGGAEKLTTLVLNVASQFRQQMEVN